tara:strand:- start:5348 stop:5758 length:411 start_codon:yes stop_codon:yes gene_type:complete
MEVKLKRAVDDYILEVKNEYYKFLKEKEKINLENIFPESLIFDSKNKEDYQYIIFQVIKNNLIITFYNIRTKSIIKYFSENVFKNFFISYKEKFNYYISFSKDFDLSLDINNKYNNDVILEIINFINNKKQSITKF